MALRTWHLVVALLVSVLAVGAIFACTMVYSGLPISSSGVIEQGPGHSALWGLRTSRFWLGPGRVLRVDGLPDDYKVPGLRVEATYEVVDVIGPRVDWDTVVELKSIRRR